MAKRFEFKNNDLELDIAGNIFTIDTADPEVIKRVTGFGEEAQKKAKELGEKDNYIEALEETIKFCLDSIDMILGEGSSKKIFQGRKVGLFDALDVINYIIAEVKADRDDKFKAYSPNRAQKRANKKK